MSKIYDHIIIGAGISGASIAYELNKYSKNLLILEKNKTISSNASCAAGGFLSPLLGKENNFKDLVNTALRYSIDFYKTNMPNLIDQCGTLRIAKNEEDKLKFEQYIPFIDFKFKEIEQGTCFFEEASIVKPEEVCKALIGDISVHYDCTVKKIEFNNNLWIIDDNYYTKNLILSTGASKSLIDEFYLKIRPVWGQRIDISTTTCISHNYHKECSVSRSIKIDNNNQQVSIGATHHRFVIDKKIDKYDTKYLLEKSSEILKLDNVKVIKEYCGARASSVDYFPLVGKIIDSNKTLGKFPYLKNGTNVNANRFINYDNLYIFNGVGGRGFVLAPYLANKLAKLILNNIDVDDRINVNRLFKREVKRIK